MLVMAYVKKKTQGKTVILVTHDKEEAKELDAELNVL
jgi:ABC-type proline/glycine betaine transport system ATPase subunit